MTNAARACALLADWRYWVPIARIPRTRPALDSLMRKFPVPAFASWPAHAAIAARTAPESACLVGVSSARCLHGIAAPVRARGLRSTALVNPNATRAQP